MSGHNNINEIAELNDMFRQVCRPVLYGSVRLLWDVVGLIQAVRDYNKFNESNDPHIEHDFGKLDWYGIEVLWKIDYYDENLRYWCDPKSDECLRVLTILLPEDY